MTRLTLRGFAARKLRTALTAFAVVLGVAMISGTYVLTDTIGRAFDDIYAKAAEGVDVTVSPRKAIEDSWAERPLEASLVERVKAVPGVAEASGEVFAEDIAINGK